MMAKNIYDKVDEFHNYCGEILRLSVGVETSLNFFIENYFCYPQSHKTFLFRDLILYKKLFFEQKIDVFKKICDHEKQNKEVVSSIKKSIRFIQKTRNLVAHGGASVENWSQGIILNKNKSVSYSKDQLKLTPEIMSRFRKESQQVLHEIATLHFEILKVDSKEKTNI